jgi:hypothetical protein
MTNASRKRNIRLIAVTLLLCGVLALVIYLLTARARESFVSAYTVYAAAESRYEIAAYKPSAESNPIRAEVSALLSEVLQVSMSAEDRLERARRGIAHLNDIEGQIDEIKNEGDLVAPLLNHVQEKAGSIFLMRNRATVKEIVSLGSERARIIGDIRGLSYRANFYSGEVFERIIDDQGALTESHVRHLNSLIPQLEEQFDARSQLYKELERTGNRMDQLANDLGIRQMIEQ